MAEHVCLIRHREYRELPTRREADALAGAGFQVHVICLADPEGGPVDVGRSGIRLHTVPLRRARGSDARYLADYLAFFLAASALVTWLHLRFRFRVIQVSSMPDFLVFATVVPKAMGARVIAFLKEPTPELGEMRFGPGWWPKLFVRVEQLAIRYADLTYTVTEQLKAAYVERGANPSKIRVVLNGPAPDAFPRSNGNGAPSGRRGDADTAGATRDFTLLCHGVIEERYGHETILRAVALAREKVPNLRFRITGDGTHTSRLRELIDELGLRDNVDFLGWVPLEQLTDELRRADVGIVAQLSSPYSNLVHTNKMYDYILFGKPVIATRLDSVSAYFGPESLYYVESGDHVGLARAIVELYRDPARREELVENAQRLYDRYGWPEQAHTYVRGFQEMART